jgi:FMN phosphatase YigB (HAD superfamily)
MESFFEVQYYSHLFGRRKPDPEAFAAILLENNLNADETHFIDDTLKHVMGAKQAGLHAVHLTGGKFILDTAQFIEDAEKCSVAENRHAQIEFGRMI